MTREEALGTTLTAAWRFWIVRRTVTRRPFFKWVSVLQVVGSVLVGAESYPIPCGFRNVFSDFLRRKTQRTDLRRKRGRGADFTARGAQMDDFHLIGIEFWSCGEMISFRRLGSAGRETRLQPEVKRAILTHG